MMGREYDGVIKGSRAEEIIWDRDAEIDRLRAALEEIVRNGDQGIHVPGPYDIAKEALAKEGK